MIVVIVLFIVAAIFTWMLRPGKGMPGSRKSAVLLSVIPPVVVAIAAVIVQLVENATGEIHISQISNTLFIVGLGLIGAGILTAAGFAIARRGEVAKGIGFGICIAVIVSIAEFGLLEWLGGV